MKLSRNTIQKDAVLQAVKTLQNHPTAEAVYDHVVVKYKNISKTTVYRNLNLLSESGELAKIAVPDGADIFDHNTYKHHHFKCTVCGNFFDFEIPDLKLDNYLLGFKIESLAVMLSGLCPDCKSKAQEV